MFGKNKYGKFWEWFEKNSELIFNFENDSENIFNLLSKELKRINKNLTFEFGPTNNNKREFTISADGIRDSFCAVEELYSVKPELEKWTILKYRQRKSIPEVRMNGIILSMEDMYFRLFNDNSKVGIIIFIKDYDAEKHGMMGFLLLDTALGEYDVETKVGHIEFLDFNSEYFVDALPFKKLSEYFDTAYEKICEEN